MKELNKEDLKKSVEAMSVYGDAVAGLHQLVIYMNEEGSRIVSLIDEDEEEKVRDMILKTVSKFSKIILGYASELQRHRIEESTII